MVVCGYCGARVERLALGRRCAVCERARKKTWEDANRERLQEKSAARRSAHREELRDYMRHWYAKHPEYGRGGGHVSGREHPKFIHGRSRTSEYRAWLNARVRCTDPACADWPNYGGRGIKMCGRWSSSFEAFVSDVGRRPRRSMQLDRIDNDGNYEPGNVRWTTRKTQGRNRRTTKLSDSDVRAIRRRYADGETQMEIAASFGMDQGYVSMIVRGLRR